MRIRSFIIAYALVLAILLFADRRPGSGQENRYSHVVDLTGAQNQDRAAAKPSAATRIIAPAALIPGTWSAGQIPAERLIAPLVVMDVKTLPEQTSQITLDEIAAWESRHGVIPQGAVVAIRRVDAVNASTVAPLPITADAAQFLMDARYVLGFAIESPTDLTSDRALARQLALHGNYVVEGATRLSSIPETGSLVIVAPIKNKNAAEASVRILAMVR
ncbi:MAG: cyclase family protein [Acidobacteriales bacterium]|nr:cyclase family protein [Terriglobales bacterium]